MTNPFPHYQSPETYGATRNMCPPNNKHVLVHPQEDTLQRKLPLQYFSDAYRFVGSNFRTLCRVLIVYVLSAFSFCLWMVLFVAGYIHLFYNEAVFESIFRSFSDDPRIDPPIDWSHLTNDQVKLFILVVIVLNFCLLYGAWLSNYFIATVYNAHQVFHKQPFQFSNAVPANPNSISAIMKTFRLYLLFVLTAPLWLIFFPITAVLLFPRLFLTPLIVVIEDVGVFRAISRSWVMTRGSWCRSIFFWCFKVSVLTMLQISVIVVAHLMHDDYVDSEKKWHISNSITFVTLIWIVLVQFSVKLWLLCSSIAQVYFYLDHAEYHATLSSEPFLFYDVARSSSTGYQRVPNYENNDTKPLSATQIIQVYSK